MNLLRHFLVLWSFHRNTMVLLMVSCLLSVVYNVLLPSDRLDAGIHIRPSF